MTTWSGCPGVSSDYNITTKRIYRAASGNTGTQFLFVAEIAPPRPPTKTR